MTEENLIADAPAPNGKVPIYWIVLGWSVLCFVLCLIPVRFVNTVMQGIKDCVLFYGPGIFVIYTAFAAPVKGVRVAAAFLVLPVLIVTFVVAIFYTIGTSGTSIGEEYNVGKHRLEKRHHLVFNQGGDDELLEVISIFPGLEYRRQLGYSSWQGPSFSNIKTINSDQIEIEYTNGITKWTEKIDL